MGSIGLEIFCPEASPRPEKTMNFILLAQAAGETTPEVANTVVQAASDATRTGALEKIRDLQGMCSRLRELERACLDQGTTDECPILKALHTEDEPG